MLCCNVSIIIALILKGGSEAQGRSITTQVTDWNWAWSRSVSGWPVEWVLNFMQKGFLSTSPGDFEDIFIKVGDSEIKEGLG